MSFNPSKNCSGQAYNGSFVLACIKFTLRYRWSITHLFGRFTLQPYNTVHRLCPSHFNNPLIVFSPWNYQESEIRWVRKIQYHKTGLAGFHYTINFVSFVSYTCIYIFRVESQFSPNRKGSEVENKKGTPSCGNKPLIHIIKIKLMVVKVWWIRAFFSLFLFL